MPIPKCPVVPVLTGSDSNNIELTVQLVTPMFGGGVVAREVDETHPIRETSIRGQLQFWWRATAGAKYANTLAPSSTNCFYKQSTFGFAY